jgi:hypothetical protein
LNFTPWLELDIVRIVWRCSAVPPSIHIYPKYSILEGDSYCEIPRRCSGLKRTLHEPTKKTRESGTDPRINSEFAFCLYGVC